MTDKEFKRLGRAQLIDIIYQFQLQVDKLTEQNQELERKLADKPRKSFLACSRFCAIMQLVSPKANKQAMYLLRIIFICNICTILDSKIQY